jgi:hypothetical protein
MNHNVKALVALAVTGQLTADQWMSLPPPLQAQLLPILIHRATKRSPREYREVANEIAKGASWGLFTAGFQQFLLVVFWLLLILAVGIAIFVGLCLAQTPHH